MKNQKRVLPLILAMIICLGLYSLCVFLIFDNYTDALWISYCFTILAIIVEFSIPLLSSRDADVKRVPVLGLSRIAVTTVYFLVQLIVGIILMATGVRTIVAVIICAVILAAYLLVTLMSVMGGSYIADVETENKASTALIKSTVAMAELAYNSERDDEKKKVLKKLYEALRYSDPISATAEIQALDASIKAKVIQVRESVRDCSLDELVRDVERIVETIQERNTLCRSSK